MQDSGCQSCKKTGPSKLQLGTIALGFYLFGVSIYGTVKLVELIISLF